jgi:hypothetical protein
MAGQKILDRMRVGIVMMESAVDREVLVFRAYSPFTVFRRKRYPGAGIAARRDPRCNQ